MGSLGPTHLIALLLVVATVAAVGGFVASTVAPRNKRRARGYLVVGFCCGLLAGGLLRRRRRGLNTGGVWQFAARTATFAVSRGRLGWPPPQWKYLRELPGRATR